MSMQQLSLMTMIAMCLGISEHAAATEQNKARQTALEVVSKLLEGDLSGAAQYFSPQAESKSAGPGSALAKLKNQRPEMFKKVDLENIVFFQQKDLEKLKQNYPDDLWQRVSHRMQQELGCLVVVGMEGTEQKGMLLMLLEQQDGSARVVYTDDN